MSGERQCKTFLSDGASHKPVEYCHNIFVVQREHFTEAVYDQNATDKFLYIYIYINMTYLLFHNTVFNDNIQTTRIIT